MSTTTGIDSIRWVLPDWYDDAVCPSVDPDVWFPEEGQGTRAAKDICLGCPVRRDCLIEALDNRDGYGKWGVRGGLSGRQRASLVRGDTPVPDVPEDIEARYRGIDAKVPAAAAGVDEDAAA